MTVGNNRKMWWYRLNLSKLMVFLFFLFVSFSFIVDKEVLRQFDFDTTVHLQDNLPRRFDEFFSFLSELGKFEPTLMILVIVLVVNRKFISGGITIFLFGMLHIIELFGKRQVEQLPPPQFMLRTKHLFDFPQFHVREEYSYPSGHAARVLFLTVLIALFVGNSKRIPKMGKYGIYAVLVGYDSIMLLSRPYLGEHWATDVIGGALLGGSLALLSFVVTTSFGSFIKSIVLRSNRLSKD